VNYVYWPVLVVLALWLFLEARRRRRANQVLTATSGVQEPSLDMPHATAFAVAARIRQLVRYLAIAFIITIALFKQYPITTYVFLLMMGVMVVGGCAYVVAIYKLRCTTCNRLMLIRSTSKAPYPFQRYEADSYRTGRYQCCYCGQQYIVKR
jgi:hypothetical protein